MMVMVLLFFVGFYFIIDMCLGSVLLIMWNKSNSLYVELLLLVVVVGLMCGDGLWVLLLLVFSIFNVYLLICMKFFFSGK